MRFVKIKNSSKILIAWLLLIACPVSLAEEVSGLYKAELPAASQDAGERKRLMEQGMRTVLQRVSGHLSVTERAKVNQALLHPDKYLRRFSYETLAAQQESGHLSDTQILRLQFDETQINGLLRNAQLPIWGSNRPLTLLWLTLDDGVERRTIASGEVTEFTEEINRHARRRGVPFILPLMDLQDKYNLPVTEAWGLFRQTLEMASERYQPDAILAGRLYRNEDQVWYGRWQFIFNGKAVGFGTGSDNTSEDLAQVIDFVADTLARHYAVNTDVKSQHKLRVTVENVLSLSAYAKVVAYFKKHAAVTRVSIMGVDRDRLVLELTAEDSVEKLQEVIALDNKLQALKTADDMTEPNLNYRWQPE